MVKLREGAAAFPSRRPCSGLRCRSLIYALGVTYGLTASAKTHSPLFYAHLEMKPGAVAEVPGGHKRAGALHRGGRARNPRRPLRGGQMLVLGAGSSHFKAKKDSTVLVLGGEPIGAGWIEQHAHDGRIVAGATLPRRATKRFFDIVRTCSQNAQLSARSPPSGGAIRIREPASAACSSSRRTPSGEVEAPRAR